MVRVIYLRKTAFWYTGAGIAVFFGLVYIGTNTNAAIMCILTAVFLAAVAKHMDGLSWADAMCEYVEETDQENNQLRTQLLAIRRIVDSSLENKPDTERMAGWYDAMHYVEQTMIANTPQIEEEAEEEQPTEPWWRY